MSVICVPLLKVGHIEGLVMLDPHRWRVTIWDGARLLRRMHDRDRDRIVQRALAYMKLAASEPPGEEQK